MCQRVTAVRGWVLASGSGVKLRASSTRWRVHFSRGTARKCCCAWAGWRRSVAAEASFGVMPFTGWARRALARRGLALR